MAGLSVRVRRPAPRWSTLRRRRLLTAYAFMLPSLITLALFMFYPLIRAAWLSLLLLNTVVFAGGVTVLSLTFDSLTAYALARLDFPGKNIIFVPVLVTLMLPFQVNLVPLFLLLNKLHWLNTYQGLILPRATNAFGIFFLRQFFLAIPEELEDAARVDGASDFYRSVILRLSVPAMLTLGLSEKWWR